jgi:diguanylate cyclase (GGDEF)-like protein
MVGLTLSAGYVVMPKGALSSICYLLVAVSSVVAIVVGVRTHRPASARSWYAIGAGVLLWTVGDVLFFTFDHVLHIEAFPSVADVPYLLGYPAVALGLVLLVRLRLTGGRDQAGLVDSAVVTVGLGLLAWVTLAGPIIEDTSQSLLAQVAGVAYPAADVLLLAMLARLVAIPGARTASYRLLAAAVITMLVADTGFVLLAAVADYPTTELDFFWLTSYLLFGAAALHPSVRTLSESGQEVSTRFTRTRLLWLTVAVLVAPVLLAVQVHRSGIDARQVDPLIAGCLAVFLLVIVRMSAAIRELERSTTQRDQLRDDLAHQAAHDALTQLVNRPQMLRLIEVALGRARRTGTLVGVMFVDLDHFKAVNDGFGHAVGDAVLREASERMRSLVRDGDTVGRLGGDEFVVLVEALTEQVDMVLLADRLVARLSAPIVVDGVSVTIGASIGVAVAGGEGGGALELVHHADVASYRAKSTGRGRAVVFDAALRLELAERAEIESALREALAQSQLMLLYQPVVSLRTGEVSGFEALVRWQRPGHGLVAPDGFVPIAERSDLVCDLGRWALHEATSQLAAWSRVDAGAFGRLTVAVNISGRHLAGRAVVDDVRDALRSSGLAADRLVVEITETVLVDEPSSTASLQALRALGVHIAIDDFGTGYTSIGQLQKLHADSMKIDRSFIASPEPGTRDLVLLMISAAHAFGLQVVAEGVEDAHQVALLREMGCDLAQGYHFARPLRAHDISPAPASQQVAVPAQRALAPVQPPVRGEDRRTRLSG